MENFSTQWFLAYYLTLGALLLSYGVYLLVKNDAMRDILIHAAGESKPPAIWRKVLKYLLLFTIPGVVLSFFPFSWIELLFSIWSLFIIYMGGQLLVMWPHSGKAILDNRDQIPRKIRYVAFNMITIGVILFMLAYILLERTRTL